MTINYELLLSMAKLSIDHGLIHDAPIFVNPKYIDNSLHAPSETFVSLSINNINRGCIGNINNPIPIFQSILFNAFKSAFLDERFPPINENIYNNIHIEIHHLLNDRIILSEVDDIELISFIKPDHSLRVSYGDYSAILLADCQKDYNSLSSFISGVRKKSRMPENVPWNKVSKTLIKTVKTNKLLLSEVPVWEDFV